jgi:hypothetical protein
MSAIDERLRAIERERDRRRRRKMLDRVASDLIRSVNRQPRKPERKPRMSEPPPSNGKWHPLEDLAALWRRR